MDDPLDDALSSVGPGCGPCGSRGTRRSRTSRPLCRGATGLQASKHILPAGERPERPRTVTHQGFEWLYVLRGCLRLILGDADLVLQAGETAECDTRTPHGVGRADTGGVEFVGKGGARARPELNASRASAMSGPPVLKPRSEAAAGARAAAPAV